MTIYSSNLSQELEMFPHISCPVPLNVWILEINIQRRVEEIFHIKKVNNMISPICLGRGM